MARRWDAKMGSYFCAGPKPSLTLLAAAFTTLVAVACGGPPPIRTLGPHPAYLEADLATLIKRANAWTSSSLKANGQLRLYWAGNEDDRHVNAHLFATRTGALRMQGDRGLVGNIFDLASNGDTFLLRIPSRRTDYKGISAAPAVPDPARPYFALRPQHLTEALLPEPLPETTVGEPGSFVSREVYPDRYALDWWQKRPGGQTVLRRRVWIERVTLRVARVESFRADGRIDFQATYANYLGPGPDAYPGMIRVERPWEDLVFRFDLEEIEHDPVLPSGAFTLRPAKGYRLTTIEEGMKENGAKRNTG
ncbi:MAG: hypothetical protein ACE5HV_10945 [Acidobacteriota bacterium]